MDVPKKFETDIWPSIRDYLPRGEKTNALYEIKNEIRKSEIKDSTVVKDITWRVIKKYFGPKVISKKNKEVANKKIDELFQVKDK